MADQHKPVAREESGAAILALRGICKSYGPVQALSNIDFDINQREIVGLLGDNGAGKSTLIKLMSGIVQKDQGSILWLGQPIELRSREESANLGIETIYQDAALVDTMSVTRNIFMGRELTNRFGFMDHARMRTVATKVLEGAVQIGGIDSPDKLVGDLSGGQKQAVAIARAVYFKRRVLLLDEPTSALSVRATEALLDYIRQLRQDGVSSVLVTHNLYHAFQVCDRFVVMSHGQKVYEVLKGETSIETLTQHVIMV
jgi:simple sugar transport system ATP-binding protein